MATTTRQATTTITMPPAAEESVPEPVTQRKQADSGRFRLQVDRQTFAALLVELLEPVEAVAAVAHHFAGLADIAELLGELQADLDADDLLFSRHGVLQCAEAGRLATPIAPRPASA